MQNSNNTKLNFPKVLLIAGQGQNVGKTTLATRIISQFTWTHKITAIKVTPHFHKNNGEALAIEKANGYQILKETTPDSDKDTSLMLQAGAEDAYLLQAEPEFLEKGFKQVMKYIPDTNLVVCESTGLRKLIIPSVFLVLVNEDSIKESAFEDEQFLEADRIISFKDNKIDFSVEDITVKLGIWKIT